MQDLFLLVKNVGLADAVELIELAHPEQVQRLLDLDTWSGDRIDTERYAEWLATIVEAYADHLETLLDDLDIEPLLVFLKKHARFHINSEEMPEAFRAYLLERDATETPDGMFYLEIPPGDPHEDFTRTLIDRLYRADMKRTRHLILTLMGELPSQLEETAYRIRAGRLEELGFLDYSEALLIYRPLPSAPPWPRVTPGQPAETVQLSPVRHIRQERNAFLADVFQAFATKYPDDDLSFDLLALSHRVMTAERFDLGDPEQQREAIHIVLDLVGLGLELMTRGKLESAVDALRNVHVQWLFRLAHTRTLELKQRARRLERSLRPEFRRLPGPHADPPIREVLEGLKGFRPHYFLGLDPGSHSGEYVTFNAVHQVERVSRALDTLRATYRFVFSHLAIDPPPDDALSRCLTRFHRALTPGGVLMTAMAHRQLGNPMTPRPLTEAQFRAWLPHAFEGQHRPGSLRPLRREFAGELLNAARTFDDTRAEGTDGPGAERSAERFVKDLLDETVKAYGALDDQHPLNPALIGGPVYVSGTD